METKTCPECGADWTNGITCHDHFEQMLFWEAENPGYGVVHHLMVLCYHLQHPSLYSPEGLRYGQPLLVEFVEHGVSPAEIRKRSRAKVDSGSRSWKIKGTPTAHGAYDRPIRWTLTAADVVARGADRYCDSVRAWARSVMEAIRVSGSAPPG